MTHTSDLTWRIGGQRTLDLRAPAVMAILNVTPDSFSDGGQLQTIDAVVNRASQALDQGALILDIGGESTRPGADRVSAGEQIERVRPAIEAILQAHPDSIVSIDTTRADVARSAVQAGAAIVNDVSGGDEDAEMLGFVAESRVGFVLMHRHTTPDADRYSDAYDRPPISDNVTESVLSFWRSQLERFAAVGGDRGAVVLDPGLGFGKSVEQNFELVRCTPELLELGRPVLSGVSRKSFVGRVSLERDSDPAEREAGTIAMTALHRAAGASVFRVHNVSSAVESLRSADATGLTRC